MGKYFLWPNWWGTFGKTEYPGRWLGITFGLCSHDTAIQFRIDVWKWHYYIVLRNRTGDAIMNPFRKLREQ